ncbi:MAG: IS66 family transposase [Deltaproteobacteria bacterium]|jgi:hypothetical protein|nr:IS66 family transposase [Deltaproteobacteria bacterium]
MNVFSDGRLELSNNRAGRCARPFAVGRNYVLSKYMCRGQRSVLQPFGSRVQAST